MNRRSVLTMMAVGVIGLCASNIARADEAVKFRERGHAVHGRQQKTNN
jgi:hypothetical protein